MTLFDHIQSLLLSSEKYHVAGQLLKNTIMEDALKLETNLLTVLMNDSRAYEAFFVTVNKTAVFDKIKFQKFISNKQFLPNSYTRFKNKIGLSMADRYLAESRDIVLSWPYKDCVLEGGQSRDSQQRQEVFWNTTLAPEEIDRLLDPKALCQWKRYDSTGIKTLEKISLDDNLLIKGNNLIALHSLKKVYQNKVKMIFIDPPYNTENDSFRYNDSFKHSTWLTFMKNRMEVARTLLSDDGLIWVSLSDKEAHYLKVLGDEVFGRDNFVADIIWNSTKSVTNTAVISDAHTHLLLFAKNIQTLKKNRAAFRLVADESKFSNPDKDPRGKWIADPFQVGGERPNQLYEIKNPNTGKVYTPNKGNSWKNEKKVFNQLLVDGRIVFGVKGDAGPQRKRFWFEAKERGQVTTTLWKDLPTTTNGTQHLKKIFSEKVFQNPKPEGLMQRIIQLSTEEGDIVLDFFAGSGTTLTTAMKMKRQFIGIEQMDYIEEVTASRLMHVIQGEAGGVSQDQNWNGGGSFVYAELAPNNQKYVDAILQGKQKKKLVDIWDDLQKEYFVSYRWNKKSNPIDSFKKMDLKSMKKLLLELLDTNEMYVHLSEMEDASYALSKSDRAMTYSFYKSYGA